MIAAKANVLLDNHSWMECVNMFAIALGANALVFRPASWLVCTKMPSQICKRNVAAGKNAPGPISNPDIAIHTHTHDSNTLNQNP